jgi:hypothetical protein
MSADAAIYQLVRDRITLSFEWGVRDCAMLAFDVILAITGKDPAPDLRGRYSTGEEAVALLRTLGGLEGIARDRFGPPAEEMRDGDIVLLHRHLCGGATSESGAFGVFWRGLVVAQGDRGLTYVQPAQVKRAWRPA